MLSKYASYCQRLSKTTTTVCVCVDVDLQLGRHNNYKFIWNPTALMLSVIAFSSKLKENTWNRVLSCVLWDIFWQYWNSYNSLPGSSPASHWHKCVFVRAGGSCDCTWRGWYGCTVVSTVASQEFACFFQIPQTSTSGGLETEFVRLKFLVTLCVTVLWCSLQLILFFIPNYSNSNF